MLNPSAVGHRPGNQEKDGVDKIVDMNTNLDFSNDSFIEMKCPGWDH